MSTVTIEELAAIVAPDAAALAPEERLARVSAFLERAGIGGRVAERMLSGSREGVPLFLLRLVALQAFLEREKRLSPADDAEVVRLTRSLRVLLEGGGAASAATPAAAAEAAEAAAPAETGFHVPLRFRKGSRRHDEEAAIQTATEQLAMICRELGVDSLDGRAMLDIGCGVKFTQAFLNRAIPVGQYHGVDVDAAMIGYLAANVPDSRFSYKAISVYNEMYNKEGTPLSRDLDIGTGGRKFDVICLFSVFTHLAPNDYAEMLALTRRHVADTGRLIFTSFVDETLPADFVDEDPARPLLRARYRESVVRRMVAEAGWRLERLNAPLRRAQHSLICAPA